MNDLVRDLLEGYLDPDRVKIPVYSKNGKVPFPMNKPLVWLTTNEVREKYGFDPSLYIDQLKSKIKPGCFCRLWFEDNVAYFTPPPTKAETIKERVYRTIKEELESMRTR